MPNELPTDRLPTIEETRAMHERAVRARKKSFDFKSRCFLYIFTRGSRCAKAVLGKYTAVSNAKLSHKLFLSVICNNCYFHWIVSFLNFIK